MWGNERKGNAVQIRTQYIPSPLPSPRQRGEGAAGKQCFPSRRVRDAGWKME